MDLLNLAARRPLGTSAGKWTAAVAVAFTLASAPALLAQNPMDAPPAAATQSVGQTGSPTDNPQTVPTDTKNSGPVIDQTLTNQAPKKGAKVNKADRVQQSRDTVKAVKKDKREDMLVGKDAQLPDKQLYDKAVAQIASGHFDVGRLDLQTLLNTYPDSQYQMRAKLAVADAWYKEGGTASLTQAEQEYKDFITFFPNVPEAAEAQLRVGDIYFKQMDVPDRDYEKGVHAEAEYRTMLKQYPDAPKALTDDAKQKLREVQEVLATREAGLGQFYASHNNWAAAIARYQTVIDTYPLYSHMDDVMIGVGDAYESQAAPLRAVPVCGPNVATTVPCMPEGAKASLLTTYDSKAAAMYRGVVLNHSAAPHVEDAKERLAGMGLPMPQPTKEQLAASEALESSRAQYNLQRRLEIFFLHRPDTVTAAQIGDPPLDDATPTYAPDILKSLQADYMVAMLTGKAPAATARPTAAGATPAGDTTAPTAPAAPAAPLALSDVPAAGESTGTVNTMTEAAPGNSTGSTGLGVEVLPSGTPAAGSGTAPNSGSGFVPPSNLPAASGAQDPNYGLKSVTPKDASALPAVEKPAEAPDQVNDAAGQKQPAITQATDKNGKPVKDKLDKNDESSSKKKPKKGLEKIIPPL